MLEIGSRVHYSGDMANASGWFNVAHIRQTSFGVSYDLKEAAGGQGRNFPGTRNIGNVYAGHCDPRFVTGAAYDAWMAARVAPAVDVRFRLDISLGGDMTLTYSQIADSLRRLADGLLDCQPEQGDNGTLVVDGAQVGTWRIE